MRICLGIEYDGSAYAGWQWQKDQPSVQQTLEIALAKVANRDEVRVICAGRTDAGVHALQQVVHFDCDVQRKEKAWVFGTNSNLPVDIRVLWAKQVNDRFNARRSALKRHYRYSILNRPVRRAVQANYWAWFYQALDCRLMQQGAEYLIGEHDFSAFRGSGCQSKSPVRCIESIAIHRHGQLIMIDVTANAFLLHMVRNIVGVLTAIGSGQYEPSWAQQVLHSRDRRSAGITAPANGLSLVGVSYPAEFELPGMEQSLLNVGSGSYAMSQQNDDSC